MAAFHLDKEPKIEPGFKAPDDYFDHFSAKVMQRLTEDEPRVVSIFARRKTWIYTAVAVVVIALMVPIVNTFTHSGSEIDNATIENYLANRTEISNDDLAEFLEVEDIQNIQIDSHLEDKAVEDLLSTNSNLEEYIVN